jgi:hypothetical protein
MENEQKMIQGACSTSDKKLYSNNTKFLIACLFVTIVILGTFALAVSTECTRHLIVYAVPYMIGIVLFGFGVMYFRMGLECLWN